MSPFRDPRGRFLPGTASPNPTGRAPLPAGVKARAETYSPALIDELNSIALNPEQPAAARVSAAQAVIDRAHGKPTAHVISEDLSADVAKWTDAQIANALQQLTANMDEQPDGSVNVSFGDGSKYNVNYAARSITERKR